jgi:Ca2+:H+ antiporter
MVSVASPDPSADECQPLLGVQNHDQSHQLGSYDRPPIWADLPRHAYEVSRGPFYGPLYLSLGLVPTGIVVGALRVNPIATSVLNFLAVLPLSAIISHSSDLLSNRVGPGVGGLINATCGNAVELIVGTHLLKHLTSVLTLMYRLAVWL